MAMRLLVGQLEKKKTGHFTGLGSATRSKMARSSAIASLNQMAGSQAWTPNDAHTLKQVMEGNLAWLTSRKAPSRQAILPMKARAAVKQAAKAGNDEAASVLHAKTHTRSGLVLMCYVQAVKGVSAPAAAQAADIFG